MLKNILKKNDNKKINNIFKNKWVNLMDQFNFYNKYYETFTLRDLSIDIKSKTVKFDVYAPFGLNCDLLTKNLHLIENEMNCRVEMDYKPYASNIECRMNFNRDNELNNKSNNRGIRASISSILF